MANLAVMIDAAYLYGDDYETIPEEYVTALELINNRTLEYQ